MTTFSETVRTFIIQMLLWWGSMFLQHTEQARRSRTIRISTAPQSWLWLSLVHEYSRRTSDGIRGAVWTRQCRVKTMVPSSDQPQQQICIRPHLLTDWLISKGQELDLKAEWKSFMSSWKRRLTCRKQRNFALITICGEFLHLDTEVPPLSPAGRSCFLAGPRRA